MDDNKSFQAIGKLLIIDRDGPGFIECILDKERVTFGRSVDVPLPMPGRVPRCSVGIRHATYFITTTHHRRSCTEIPTATSDCPQWQSAE